MAWNPLLDRLCIYFTGCYFHSTSGQVAGTTVHSQETPLASGQSYTESLEVELPRGIGGTYYIHISTDLDLDSYIDGGPFPPNYNEGSRTFYSTSVYEGEGANERNNIGSAPIPITYREPDLQVTNITVPAIRPKSGELIDVSWTVTNTGTRDTRNLGWSDRVYLSSDPSLDSEDKLLDLVFHGTPLLVNQSYTTNRTLRLPDGISGDFYLLVFTDDTSDDDIFPIMGKVEEFRDEGNNISSKLMPVDLTPPPDLQVTSVIIPQEALAGQFFDLSYLVTNNGLGSTPARQNSWNDLIYLSVDPILNQDSDTFLASEFHQGILASQQSYQVNGRYRLPRGLSGTYYVFVITDPAANGQRGNVFEHTAEFNNAMAASQPLLVVQPPPADLYVTQINGPSNGLVGQSVDLSWTITNRDSVTVFPAQGSWSDAIYLSTDAVWDVNDRLIGRTSRSGPLATGESYTATLQATLPAVTPGAYRLIVRSDIFDEVFEGPDEGNNRTASSDTLEITVQSLHLGVRENTTLSTGQERLYRIDVEANQTLRVALTTTAEEASNELFIRYGSIPTNFAYDAIYSGALQPNQTVIIGGTQPGTYFVLVRGQSEPSANTPIALMAEVLPFQVLDIVQDRGGDNRYVTLTVLGAQFDPDATLTLIRPGIAEFAPVRYQVLDSTRIDAVFDLRSAPHAYTMSRLLTQAVQGQLFLIDI